VDSERERSRITNELERLEESKQELERSNARTIDENKNLLDQLEELNSAVGNADIHIQSLNATLLTSYSELQRLTILAGRAAQLESQLMSLEAEQVRLQADLVASRGDSRGALQRWKCAEGLIGQLQNQIDRMEKEAQEEHERHMALISRVEYQKSTKAELNSNVLKASAIQGDHARTSAVVSHFVNDILQDNANLQIGIVEVREMLLDSNAEVEALRTQLELHQPLVDSGELPTPLHEELGRELNKQAATDKTSEPQLPEVHVHHHYHQPTKQTKRPKKRRPLLSNGHLSRLSTTSTHADALGHPLPSQADSRITMASMSMQSSHKNRWSMRSSASGYSVESSSLATSPRQASSIFDTMDMALSSRPTTPSSSVPASPIHNTASEDFVLRWTGIEDRFTSTSEHLDSVNQDFRHSHPGVRQNLQGGPGRCEYKSRARLQNGRILPSMSTVGVTVTKVTTAGPAPAMSLTLPFAKNLENSIPEELEPARDDQAAEDGESGQRTPRPQLHRMRSTESVISIAGMDIQTSEHSLLSKPIKRYGLRPAASHANVTGSTAVPTVSSLTATVHPPPHKPLQKSSEYNKCLLQSQVFSQPEQETSIGRRVGNWVWSKWSVMPEAGCITDSRRPILGSESVGQTKGTVHILRMPGVNQSGPVQGFGTPIGIPRNVQPLQINARLLEEALAEN